MTFLKLNLQWFICILPILLLRAGGGWTEFFHRSTALSHDEGVVSKVFFSCPRRRARPPGGGSVGFCVIIVGNKVVLIGRRRCCLLRAGGVWGVVPSSVLWWVGR